MGNMMGTREASDRWGYPRRLVWEWCRAGRIDGATHSGPGSDWKIPAGAKCPMPVKNTPPENDTPDCLPG